MGNEKSKAKAQRKEKSTAEPGNRSPRQGKLMEDTKKVLVIHSSATKEQEAIVRHFRDALTDKASGGVRVEKMVNIANESGSALKDSSWLDEVNSVVLVCLKEEAIEMLEQIIREKGYIKDDRLHGKVFTVSFGAKLQWPPDGVEKGSEHARDFVFNFENVENLKPNNFEKCEKMTSLVAAIKGT